jgi:drug/metabolite transporter (DMT)-like permease
MEALALAFGAAVCLGMAAVLQQRAARTAVAPHPAHPALFTQLLRRPVWLAGVLAMVAGYALQAMALGSGRITLVEPVLVCSLILGLPLSALWLRQRLTLRDWLSAAAVAMGVGAFLLVGRPRGGADDAPADRWMLALCAVGAAAIVVIMLGATRRTGWRPLGFAVAGGLGLGLADAITKPVVLALSASPWQLLTSWEPYALIAIGGLAFFLVQAAYHSGHIARSLPAVTVLEPVTASLLGVALFEERVRSGSPELALETVAVFVAAVGVFMLARSPLIDSEPQDHVPSAGPPGIGTLDRP